MMVLKGSLVLTVFLLSLLTRNSVSEAENNDYVLRWASSGGAGELWQRIVAILVPLPRLVSLPPRARNSQLSPAPRVAPGKHNQ
jgi:hypothetical protein